MSREPKELVGKKCRFCEIATGGVQSTITEGGKKGAGSANLI